MCFFQEHNRDVVQQAVRQFVRVEGQGEFEAGSTEPSKIDVASIAILYEALPFDPQAFWQRIEPRQLSSSDAHGLGALIDDPWRDDDEAAQLISAIRQGS